MPSRRSRTTGFELPKRFVRSILSVVILSAFVLLVAFVTRWMSGLSVEEVVGFGRPLFGKLGLDEKKVGEVAGEFVKRVGQTQLGELEGGPAGDSATSLAGGFSVAVMSDIHGDLDNLTKALRLAKERGVEAVFVLGDLTNFGTIADLQKVKKVLDESGIKYYAIPGDHDLAQAIGVENFLSVFGRDYYDVEINSTHIILLNNSANFTKVEPESMRAFVQNVTSASFVLLAQPLYTQGLIYPFGSMYMGSSKDEVSDQDLKDRQEGVKEQGTEILGYIWQSSVKAVFAGDHHRTSELGDPVKDTLVHNTVGAVGASVNEMPQTAIQTPRFELIEVSADGSYKVEDVVID